jgi:hypothetical protein
MAVINYLVEGDIDEIAVLRIIQDAGHEAGVGYGKRGYGYIKNKIQGFNQSAQGMCYLALADFMDTKCSCPSEAVATLLPHPNANMLFRIVVREIESWLLADRKNIAKFLDVTIESIPERPEEVSDPKLLVVNLARRSRSSKIRSSLVPEENSTAQVGKLYTSEIKRYIRDFWDLDSARKNSPSLNKCLQRLGEI